MTMCPFKYVFNVEERNKDKYSYYNKRHVGTEYANWSIYIDKSNIRLLFLPPRGISIFFVDKSQAYDDAVYFLGAYCTKVD